jgi:hypothetical protein
MGSVKEMITRDRRSSRSFFLNRGFCKDFLIPSSHSSLCASVEVGNVAMGDGRLGNPDPSTLSLAFFGGNLNGMHQFVGKQKHEPRMVTSVVDHGL